ncbi:hypothetical protein Bhyg_08743 [Pseudolycoriella hygida]|uniref:Uncharacterized protein n=1 Tax=Pseudolycoriella hygida TaxID=35572 RepID=A0A9Q0N570_9DIPT|nr:hypothetical protein Bhyg_08743 [Pseudolycoriella hygida]
MVGNMNQAESNGNELSQEQNMVEDVKHVEDVDDISRPFKDVRREVRNKFIAVVNFYRAEKIELALNDSELMALRDLREMWVNERANQKLDYYNAMSKHHEDLSGKLIKHAVWKEYLGKLFSLKTVLLQKYFTKVQIPASTGTLPN